MSAADWAVLALVAVAVVAAACNLRKMQRRGGCSGSCEGCARACGEKRSNQGKK